MVNIICSDKYTTFMHNSYTFKENFNEKRTASRTNHGAALKSNRYICQLLNYHLLSVDDVYALARP